MTTPYDTINSAILGVPFDPNKKPSRQGVVQAFSEMQVQLEAAQAGALIKSTRTLLNAMVVAPVSAMAWVINDPTAVNNGIYENTGTATAAVWTRRADIPQFLITGINSGEGTVNAIQVTTNLPLPVLDGRALILVPIVGANTSTSVTISFNGGTALPIVSNSGLPIDIGGFTSNVVVAGFVTNGQFRLINDEAIAALILQAKDATFGYLNQVQSIRDTIISLASASLPTTYEFAVGGATQSHDFGNTALTIDHILSADIDGLDVHHSKLTMTAGVLTPNGTTWPVGTMQVVIGTGLALALGAALPIAGSVGDASIIAGGLSGTILNFLQSGTGAVLRTMQSKARDMVSVMDFGAVADGTLHLLSERFATLGAAQAVYPFVTALTQSIDYAAFQAAVNAAVSGKKRVYIPAGDYSLNNKITSGVLRGLVGDGKGASNLIWEDLVSCGIEAVYTTYGQNLYVEGITFRQKGIRRGTALFANFNAMTVDNWPGVWPRFTVRDCSFEGTDIPTQQTGWDGCIDTIAGAYGQVISCDFVGVIGAQTPAGVRSLFGIRYRGSVDNAYHNGHPVYCIVDKCNIDNFKNAIIFDGCEGVIARDNSLVEVDNGIVVSGNTTAGSGARPAVMLSGNHANVYLNGFVITDMADIQAIGNEIYKLSTSTVHAVGIGIYANTGITGAGDLIATGNFFMDATGAASDFDAINIGGPVSKGIIDGNNFKRVRYGVTIQAGVSAIRVGDRNIFNAETANVSDSGTGNFIASVNIALIGSSRGVNGVETKWGTTFVTLNGTGDAIVTFDAPFKTATLAVVAGFANPAISGGACVVQRSTFATNQFIFSVRPNPGAIGVDLCYVAVGH